MGDIFSSPDRWLQVPAHARRMPPSELARFEDDHDEGLTHEKAAINHVEKV